MARVMSKQESVAYDVKMLSTHAASALRKYGAVQSCKRLSKNDVLITLRYFDDNRPLEDGVLITRKYKLSIKQVR